jgi:hypothetical protein
MMGTNVMSEPDFERAEEESASEYEYYSEEDPDDIPTEDELPKEENEFGGLDSEDDEPITTGYVPSGMGRQTKRKPKKVKKKKKKTVKISMPKNVKALNNLGRPAMRNMNLSEQDSRGIVN